MRNEIAGPGGVFRFDLVDIRELDGEILLASENPSDNVIAILTKLGSEPDAVRRVLKRIGAAPPEERDEALAELAIFTGLRKLDDEFKREIKLMPIQEDIMENTIVGPMLRQASFNGQMRLILAQIEERFGSASPGIRHRLAALSPEDLEAAGRRILRAQRVEDLFSR